MTTETKLAVAGALVAAGAAISTMSTQDGKTRLAAALPTPQVARFLTQATFGVTDADLTAVANSGFSVWMDQQMAMTPVSMAAYAAARKNANPKNLEVHNFIDEFFWTRVTTGSDQLRQRMAYALSQIFVITRQNETLNFDGAMGTANYYDILTNNAFGNYRTLIEQITLNPMMGIFLSYVKNDKEDPASGRHPDENFAREIMQLMSIGTIQLNLDGSPKLDASGNTIPTYTHDDIAGLSKVFTGISWYSSSPNDGTFLSAPDAYSKPMIFYPTHHSTSEKTFLGRTIPASAVSDPAGDLKIALDTIFAHPNVPPFIARRLIQQFVTSNPSPAYIQRVARIFHNNGSGVRGDLDAVLRAVLLDTEARNDDAAQADPNFGKLREPLIRLANWMRSFSAKTKNGSYEIDVTSDAGQLGQGFLDAPSVFNFWRFGYIPPHTRMGNQNLYAPEFQIVNELTAASYINYIQGAVATGVGFNNKTYSGIDVSSDYTAEIALAQTPDALLDRLNTLLFYGRMSAGLRQTILGAVNSVKIPSGTGSKVTTAILNRAKLAITLSLVSGEYLVQR